MEESEKKEEEKPKEEKANDEKKAEETPKEPPPPPPPQEIVLRVYMHCEGCAKKVRRCLKGFEGNFYIAYLIIFMVLVHFVWYTGISLAFTRFE